LRLPLPAAHASARGLCPVNDPFQYPYLDRYDVVS
jgi:hypothetical protein